MVGVALLIPCTSTLVMCLVHYVRASLRAHKYYLPLKAGFIRVLENLKFLWVALKNWFFVLEFFFLFANSVFLQFVVVLTVIEAAIYLLQF